MDFYLNNRLPKLMAAEKTPPQEHSDVVLNEVPAEDPLPPEDKSVSENNSAVENPRGLNEQTLENQPEE